MEQTMKTARALALKSRGVLRSLKKVINCGNEVDLGVGCALEAEAFGLCFGSEDMKEGVSAFLEKRKPEFKGTLVR